ncbi:hypothetical protein CDAR_551351 [Caerostris darwini]|uniref:Uncharacterized protein n=1 Tax=Caerostris darwini TaxID=1538125 RepID=A0AAV4V5M7_9ARAC|nr:hypothetical protein CDAR_551351 [Caerostris darwini]
MMDQRRISELSFDTRITQMLFPQRSIDSENVQYVQCPVSSGRNCATIPAPANQVLAVVTDTDNTGKDKKRSEPTKGGNFLRSVPISGRRSPIVPAGSPSVTQSDAIKRSLFMSPAFLQKRTGAGQQKERNLLRSVPISGQRSPVVSARSLSVTQSDAIRRPLFVSPAFLQ